MAAAAVASAGLTVAVGRSVAVGATMVGTGCGVAVAMGASVGVIGGAGIGAAASRRDPHPVRTSKAMLAPSASTPCRVSHPGVPRTVSPGAERLKEQRPAPWFLRALQGYPGIHLSSHAPKGVRTVNAP